MTLESLQKAKQEAKEFIKRCEALQKDHNGSGYIYGGKLSGAVRRQSMELTRALTELRKA